MLNLLRVLLYADRTDPAVSVPLGFLCDEEVVHDRLPELGMHLLKLHSFR